MLLVCSAVGKAPGKNTSRYYPQGWPQAPRPPRTTVRGEILINLWLQSEVHPQAAAAQQLENEIFKCKHSFFTWRERKKNFPTQTCPQNVARFVGLNDFKELYLSEIGRAWSEVT